MPEGEWKRRNYGESWSTGDTYNAAFGQGYVTTTPLQLLVSIMPMINGGTIYQPRIARNLQDASGNIIERFEPAVIRTLVMPQGDQLPVLLLQEDMLLHGENSLACRCEPDSDYYDEEFCNSVDLDNYTAQFDRDPNLDDDVTDIAAIACIYRMDTRSTGRVRLLEQQGVQRALHPAVRYARNAFADATGNAPRRDRRDRFAEPRCRTSTWLPRLARPNIATTSPIAQPVQTGRMARARVAGRLRAIRSAGDHGDRVRLQRRRGLSGGRSDCA